jgi:N-acetylglucosamine kinase-like BadF-type ATPase
VSRRPALLAVDGGGSKIDAALLRKDGSVLGAARTRTKEFGENGGEQHMAQVLQAVTAACRDANVDPDRLPVAELGVYCLAGADLPADDRKIARWLKARDVSVDDVVRNDTFAVLRAGTDRSWGVGVVCGYGINCSAVAPDGRITRYPAVGPISGDWGGGVEIGQAAIWHAIRAEDGRGDATSLRELVPRYLGFRTPRQVLEALYYDRLDWDRIGELPPVIFGAAREGDRVARSIVDRQADEVVAMAGTAIRRLRMTKLDVHVVLGGGIFRNDDPGFFQRIDAGLHAVAPTSSTRVLIAPPVIGAALIGLDRIGAAKAARARARRGLTHDRLTTQTRARGKERS